MSTELATQKKNPFDIEEMQFLAPEIKNEIAILSKAGVFSDAKDIYKTLSKILIGKGMGLDPQLAVRGIILQSNGLPSFTANLMSTLIKKSGKYDYISTELYDEKGVYLGCKIVVEKKRDGRWIDAGNCTFTMEDAKVAGLASKDTFKKFPKNMCFARCISNACKWFCPDVFGGYTAYTPDEVPNKDWDVDGETLEPVQLKKSAVKKTSQIMTVEDGEVESHADVEKRIKVLIKETQSDEIVLFNHFGVVDYSDMTYEQLLDMEDLLLKKLTIQKIS